MSTTRWPEGVGPSGPFGGFSTIIAAVIWMEFTLATMFIALRVFTRYWCGKNGGWALSWTGLSWLIGLIAQICLTAAIHKSNNGFGPGWTVPNALALSWSSIYLTFVAIGFGKIAVISFILALQGFTHPKPRYFLYFVAATNMIVNISFVLFAVYRCSPASDAFIMGREASCSVNFMAAKNFGYFAGAYNALTDLLLALYPPLLLLRTLQISRPLKTGISIVMSLGFIAFGCAAVKTYHLRWVNDTMQLNYKIYCLTIWTYTEMWAVLITCSIPPLWPLCKRVLPTATGSISGARNWFGSRTPLGSGSRTGSSSAEKRSYDRSYGSRSEKRSRTLSGGLGGLQVHLPSTSRSIAEGGPHQPQSQLARDRARSTTPLGTRGHRFMRSRSSPDEFSLATGNRGDGSTATTMTALPRLPSEDNSKRSRSRGKDRERREYGDDLERQLLGDVNVNGNANGNEVDDFSNSWDPKRSGIMVTREFTVETENVGVASPYSPDDVGVVRGARKASGAGAAGRGVPMGLPDGFGENGGVGGSEDEARAKWVRVMRIRERDGTSGSPAGGRRV